MLISEPVVLQMFGEPAVLMHHAKWVVATTVAIVPGIVYTVKRTRVRRRLDRRVPPRRLRIDGVKYVH